MICEYFLEEEVQIIKRNKLSYLSNEKYKWKKKIIRMDNNQKGMAPLFYEKLYKAIRFEKDFEVSVDSVIETMKVLNEIIIKTN